MHASEPICKKKKNRGLCLYTYVNIYLVYLHKHRTLNNNNMCITKDNPYNIIFREKKHLKINTI